MTASIIDGRALAQEVYSELDVRIAQLSERGIIPRIAIISIGSDELDKRRVALKENAAMKHGMESVTYCIREDVAQERVIELIERLNNDPLVHGIIVQTPMPPQLDDKTVLDAIHPLKDIDGLHFCNAGKLLNGEPAIVACTPRAIIRIIDSIGVDIQAKHTVVVGKSILVGRPIAICFLNRNATVSVCHTKTTDLASLTRNADILVVAAGSPALIKADMVKEGAVVIDVGQTNVDGHLKGDVDFPEVSQKASYITKAVGGVGPMTVAMLMTNLVDCAEALNINK